MSKKDAIMTASGVTKDFMVEEATFLAEVIIEHAKARNIPIAMVPCIALNAAGFVTGAIFVEGSSIPADNAVASATRSIDYAVRKVYKNAALKDKLRH